MAVNQWWMNPISSTNQPPQRQATQQALTTTTQPGATNSSATGALGAVNSSASKYANYGQYGAGGNMGGSFAGFDFGQQDSNRDVSKSAKYAFANAAGRSGVMPKTKEEAQSWFTSNVSPYLANLGYKVYDVQGDKAFVGTRENPSGEWIDFIQGAGGDNPMFAWQSEGPASGMGQQFSQFGQDNVWDSTQAMPDLKTLDMNDSNSVAKIQAMWANLTPEQQQEIATQFSLGAANSTSAAGYNTTAGTTV